MTTHQGAVGIIAMIGIGLLVLAGAGYVAYMAQRDVVPRDERVEQEQPSTARTEPTISWKFNDMDFDANNTPHTEVIAYVNGTEYVIGTFEGSCAPISASGGVDGTGLLAGELSAVQCWFAGGGDEIGVFAHEDHGYQIMVGRLEEPIEGAPGFRGDFKITFDIP